MLLRCLGWHCPCYAAAESGVTGLEELSSRNPGYASAVYMTLYFEHTMKRDDQRRDDVKGD